MWPVVSYTIICMAVADFKALHMFFSQSDIQEGSLVATMSGTLIAYPCLLCEDPGVSSWLTIFCPQTYHFTQPCSITLVFHIYAWCSAACILSTHETNLFQKALLLLHPVD